MSFLDDIKDFGTDIYDRLKVNAVAESERVETGESTFATQTADWLRSSIDKYKTSLVTDFRESSTGRELISEVKQQEIQQAFKDAVPYIAIVGLIVTLMRS